MIGESKKVAIQNLGCSKNQVDGERILALFASRGCDIVEDYSTADIIIVNTCAFIKEAQEEAIETILESAAQKKTGQCKTLVVSGCFSERYRDKVKKDFPEVDVWAGVDDWETILSSIIKKGCDLSLSGDNNDCDENYGVRGSPDRGAINRAPTMRVLSEPVSTQYIKIAEGCSHICTFCVIPSIRGKFKSRQADDIIQEAKWLYDQGTRELILVAQDTSYYGKDIHTNLVGLLERILKQTNFPWIRMMYLHPQLVGDDLLTLIAAEPRLCPYFDIPLQHISNDILKAMNRQPMANGIYNMIDRIRQKVPNATLRTSFITGFPGEGEKEFKELKRFIQEIRFDKLGIFPFSPEEGTPAAAMRPRPRAATVQKRCEELMVIQQDISRELLEDKIGSVIPIIIDRISDDHDFNYEARTRGDAPEVDGRVFIANGTHEIGAILNAKIIGASDYDLYAEIVL